MNCGWTLTAFTRSCISEQLFSSFSTLADCLFLFIYLFILPGLPQSAQVSLPGRVSTSCRSRFFPSASTNSAMVGLSVQLHRGTWGEASAASAADRQMDHLSASSGLMEGEKRSDDGESPSLSPSLSRSLSLSLSLVFFLGLDSTDYLLHFPSLFIKNKINK